MPTDAGPPLNLFELEAAARARLPQMAFDYYASGAHDELTLRENRAAFERVALHYRVLVDASQRDLRTTVLGHPLAMPVLIAPTAFHRMAHPDGELATARAAEAAGTLMTLSTLSNTPIEAVVEAAGRAPVWFQLYVYRDREATRDLVARAEAAGCTALVLTVDAPLLGTRERDVRNRFHLPDGLELANLHGRRVRGKDAELLPEVAADSGLAAYVAALLEPGLTWSLVDWLASITRLPLLIKGVVRADDAARAADHGAAAVVVSNHGGRQLDGAPATIDVLPRIRERVGDTLPLLMDGGVRRGTDVIKAIARGAQAVLVGRPVLWGLAVDGQRGVETALRMLRDELDLAMALCGCPSIADITPELLGA